MKTNTNRFETVLPDSLRRRYRVPCQKLNAEQNSRNKSSGNSWPSADSDPIKLGNDGAAIAPKPRVDWEAIKNTPLEAPSAPSRRFWIILFSIVTLIMVGLHFGEFQKNLVRYLMGKPVAAASMQPAPILSAMPVPTPVATLASPEVRRAHRIARAHMPDGSSLIVTILGAVNRQEELPLSGNSIGDTYYVAGVPFVWTDLSGGGGWLDPAIEIK